MLIDAGFPRPQTQIPVLGPDGYPRYFLDMGWEELKLAVEYEGVQHADQLGYDIVRADYITRAGWTHVRVAAGHRRPAIIARVEREWDRLWRPELGITPRRTPLAGPHWNSAADFDSTHTATRTKAASVLSQRRSCSVAASRAQVARPSIASRTSDGDGNVGAMRMFLSSGSLRYGKDAPASVTAIPASLANATVRLAVPNHTSRLTK